MKNQQNFEKFLLYPIPSQAQIILTNHHYYESFIIIIIIAGQKPPKTLLTPLTYKSLLLFLPILS